MSFEQNCSEQYVIDEANESWGIDDVEDCEWSFLFFPRLLYTIIGTVLAILVSSLMSDPHCFLVNIFLFYF